MKLSIKSLNSNFKSLRKEKNDSDSSSEHSISEEKKVDDTNNKNKNIKTDKIFLSSLYELFEEYDEIIIQKDKEKQLKLIILNI